MSSFQQSIWTAARSAKIFDLSAVTQWIFCDNKVSQARLVFVHKTAARRAKCFRLCVSRQWKIVKESWFSVAFYRRGRCPTRPRNAPLTGGLDSSSKNGAWARRNWAWTTSHGKHGQVKTLLQKSSFYLRPYLRPRPHDASKDHLRSIHFLSSDLK